MDNRWRFLYCGMTELWGHVRKAEAGNGQPGASGVPATLANPGGNEMCIRDSTDYDGHMNGDAAKEYSEVLAQVLESTGQKN